ncbi:MAG: DUF4296 domain-containing protein [Bacteroidales bacterium]|nr:DUF4296 domain-containing protein [Candidatus Colimorpha onthohippi]
MCLSCGGRPADLLSEQQMVDFLTEAYLIEGFYGIETGYHYDELTPEIIGSYEELLDRKGISRDRFERSVKYYMSKQPEQYKHIHDMVVEQLEERSNSETRE